MCCFPPFLLQSLSWQSWVSTGSRFSSVAGEYRESCFCVMSLLSAWLFTLSFETQAKRDTAFLRVSKAAGAATRWSRGEDPAPGEDPASCSTLVSRAPCSAQQSGLLAVDFCNRLCDFGDFPSKQLHELSILL